MDYEDSDVEILGSPVFPTLKEETYDNASESDCTDVADLNEEEIDDQNVDSDIDKDPMGLLDILNQEESSDNEKQMKALSAKENRDLNDENQNYCDKASSSKETTKEGSSEKESGDENAHEKLNKQMTTVPKNDAAALKNERLFARHVETWPWLCRDPDDPNLVFCLYCFVSLRNYKKHVKSQHHQEREIEYCDFQKNAGADTICFRSNKDFDGDNKKEREKLEKNFTDYLWDLWCKSHDWIVRTVNGGHGYCKYCGIELNVSTVRLRRSHEESHRHKEGKKKYPKRRKTVSGDVASLNSEYSDSSTKKSIVSRATKTPDPTQNDYFEKSKNSADLCRCKLCDITMFKTSFVRHSCSNLHKQNLAVLHNPVVPDIIEKPDWQSYQALHPWLIEDPNNPMEAFCKYCEKRIVHGNSAAKRLIHEHSAPHKAAVKKSVGADSKQTADTGENDSESKEAESGGDSEDGQSSMEEDKEDKNESEDRENVSEEDNESENKSESYAETDTETETTQKSNSDLWVKPSWIKPYKRDGKYVFCRCCKTKLQNSTATVRLHCQTQRHISKEKIFVRRSDAARIGYPWLVRFKNNRDVVSCKYCGVRFSARANRAAHQRSRRHMEALKNLEENSEKQVQDKPVTTIKVVTKPPLRLAKRATKKASQKQLKSLFEWLQFKRGHQVNYGYCTICEKQIFIPSIKYGQKHRRTGNHIRAQNKLKKQETASLKRNKSVSDREQDEGNVEELSAKTSKEPPPKRFKPNSLHTAIQIAKRLTSVHLEMLTFMRNNGHSILRPSKSTSVHEKTPTTTGSTMAELSATLSPILHAATQSTKRDPFDLFFNSISESIKVLPADLASEAKLKVMQVLFELETRAQQRLSQQQPPSDLNTGAQNVSNNGNTQNDIQTQNDFSLENQTMHIEQETVRIRQEPQRKQQQNQESFTVTTTSTPSKSSSPRHFLTQLSASNLTPQTQAPQNNITKTATTSKLSPLQANRIVHVQRKTQQQPPQVSPQRNQSPTSQLEGLIRHRAVTNQLNNLVNNVNQRMNMSLPVAPVKTNEGLTISSVNSLVNDNQSNGNTPRLTNRPNQVRAVPLSSLTKAKYQNTMNEPAFHQIQLNSSTQSKIITIDASNP